LRQKLCVRKNSKSKKRLKTSKWVERKPLNSPILPRPTTPQSKAKINETSLSSLTSMSRLRNSRLLLETHLRKQKPLKRIKSSSFKTIRVSQ
jgi:hypothetical protein